MVHGYQRLLIKMEKSVVTDEEKYQNSPQENTISNRRDTTVPFVSTSEILDMNTRKQGELSGTR